MKKIIFVLAAAALLAMTFISASLASVATDTSYTFINEPATFFVVDGNWLYDANTVSFDVSGYSDTASDYVGIALFGDNFSSIVGKVTNATKAEVYNLGKEKNGTYSAALNSDNLNQSLARFSLGDTIKSIVIYPDISDLSDGAISFPSIADGQNFTISNLVFNGKPVNLAKSYGVNKLSEPQTAVPEPATFAYGAMGLLSILGLKKKLHK